MEQEGCVSDPVRPYVTQARWLRRQHLENKVARGPGPESDHLRRDANACLAKASRIQRSRRLVSQQAPEVVTIENCSVHLQAQASSKREIHAEATHVLSQVPVGGKVAIAGLDSLKEARAIVHGIAHHLGFKQKKHKDSEGRLFICLERSRLPDVKLTTKLDVGSKSPVNSQEDVDDHVSTRKGRWKRGTINQPPEQEVKEIDCEGAAKSSSQAASRVRSKRWSSNSGASIGSVCVVWLRDDMRLHDNPALLRAAQGDFSVVVPVFIHDEQILNPHPMSGAALVWKHESLSNFSSTLAGLGSQLVIRRGDPVEEILGLLEDVCSLRQGNMSTPLIVFNRRCEPWFASRDKEVAHQLRLAHCRVQECDANCLFEPSHLRLIDRWQDWRARVRNEKAASEGRSSKIPPLEHISGFGSFCFLRHALEDIGNPPRPCATVQSLPPCIRVPSLHVEDLGFGFSSGHGFTSKLVQFNTQSKAELHAISPNSNNDTGTQWDWAAHLRQCWTFGEHAALDRMEHFISSICQKGVFAGRTRLLANQSNTSELSPYIRFGELSVRTVFWAAYERQARDTNQKESCFKDLLKKEAAFLRRFLWRELAYWFLWTFPSLPSVSLRPQYEKQLWTGTQEQLKSWKKGRTGFPLVDAAMTQLWAVGWLPNYMRHVVAQTLIEYLDISWKEGFRWFDWTLVDSDCAINSYMWQNGGHSGPDQWNFVLHPVNAAKACDPDGSYVKRWLPFLAHLPPEYVHRPWDAPPAGWRQSTMLATTTYVARIVEDLDTARRSHAKRVLNVRRAHPELISRTGHEWLRLGGGLLAKVVSRDEFRAETEDFIVEQRRGHVGQPRKRLHGDCRREADAAAAALADSIENFESHESGQL